MQSISSFVVIGNEDGAEAGFSAESSRAVADALGARVVMLNAYNWVSLLSREYETSIFFLATHGGYAEDGTLQGHLEDRGLRHTHSRAGAASLMASKHDTKLRYSELGIPTPPWRWSCTSFGEARTAMHWVVKPNNGGGKAGLVLQQSPGADPACLSEEYIAGEYEVSAWILGSTDAIGLPPMLRHRRINDLGVLLDLEEGPPPGLATACLEMAHRFHSSIGARGLTKTDFVIDERGSPWAIETDAHPGLGERRGAARQARKAGYSLDDMIAKIANDHG